MWPASVLSQRFLRQGFSNQEDFGAEMELDDKEAAVDMTREMFLMQNLNWQLPKLESSQLSHISDGTVRRHVQKYLGSQPVELKLFKKRGKYGLRAVGKTGNKGPKLRAFWRQADVTRIPRSSDFLSSSYADAVQSRLFTVEFEVQLPPISKKKSSTSGLPSVIYRFSVEPGSMNPKALVPRGAGSLSVLPNGKGGDKVPAGTCTVGVVPMKPGLVDPSWAKGRPVFRRGKSVGLI
jgi:hypothetical protein